MKPAMTASNGNGGLETSYLACGKSEVDAILESGDGGFHSLAHYCLTASRAQHNRGEGLQGSDRELWGRWTRSNATYRNWVQENVAPGIQRVITSPDGMAEITSPDGGATIPPHFVRQIFDKSRFRVTPWSLCRIVTTPSNAGCMPSVAETSRVDGSRWGGMTSYWSGEAQQGTKTWPRLMNAQFRLKKLVTLVPVSGELLQDADMLEGFLDYAVAGELSFQMNNTLIHGTGVGQALGVVGGPGTITIAKDTGQAAATISATNVGNMWTQFHGPSRANGVWFANEEFDVDTLALPTSPVTGWMPPVEAPTMRGRPCYSLENCPALGTPGDLVLADWSQVLMIVGGFRKSLSLDFKFDADEGYFRFISRVDAQPLWMSPLTSAYGTKVKSAYLVLAQR